MECCACALGGERQSNRAIVVGECCGVRAVSVRVSSVAFDVGVNVAAWNVKHTRVFGVRSRRKAYNISTVLLSVLSSNSWVPKFPCVNVAEYIMVCGLPWWFV